MTRALTVVAEIRDRAALDQLLALIAEDLDGNAVFRPRDLPDTHFMRFVIIDDQLVWESNHDGATERYLLAVLGRAPEIGRVFAACVDYPHAPAEQLTWLKQRCLRASAFYAGYRGISRRQIANDRKVHDAIRTIIDDPHERERLVAMPPHAIHDVLADRLRRDPTVDTATDNGNELRWFLGKLAALAALVVVLPFLLVIGPFWFLALRKKETTDAAITYDRPVHDDHNVAALEDKITQNQLTHVVDVKPGRFRFATLVVVLATLDVIARVYAVRGELGGITSIHFARWVILRDPHGERHRLAFFSSYDGSWEAYLGEFIDRAAYGLSAVWSNTVGFPRTRALLYEGARDEEAFKNWTRGHQIPTQVWWSSVPDRTVQNIRDDVMIRRQLDRGLADEEVRAWLRKL